MSLKDQRPRLTLEGVSFGFEGAPVVEGIDLSVAKGEILALLGPSGCGKTSLLRILAGLIQPGSGRATLGGAPPKPGVGAAMVFQSYRLLPWKTLRGNIAFALPHLSKPEREARVEEALRLVGLTRFGDFWPSALSGGMKQRAALARALAPRPDFLLMDEPFAALDAQARELMQGELLRLVQSEAGEAGPGVVFVTHSVDEALALGDEVLVLSPRPGRVEARIRPPFPPPRWRFDPREHPAWPELRRQLWERLRASVLEDPNSDFRRLPDQGP